jgi:hypothetical protein
MNTWATVSRTGATRRSEEKSLKRSKASTQRHLIQNKKTKLDQSERQRERGRDKEKKRKKEREIEKEKERKRDRERERKERNNETISLLKILTE